MKGFLILAIFTAFACDAPQKVRYPSSGAVGSSIGSGASGDANGVGNESGQDSQWQEDGQSDQPSNSEPGFENCNLGHRYNAGSVGAFGICQNEYYKSQIKISMAQTSLNPGTCFVPMRIQGSKSYNLGVAQCVHNQADKTYFANLTTFRSDPINGVMVLKATSVEPFMRCMGARSDYQLGKLPPSVYQTYGSPEAYASYVCTNFVQTHSNNYKQVQFNQ